MDNIIGERIEATLSEKNMTIKELAKKSGVGDRNIRRYISGESTPNLSKIPAMSEVLGVTSQWLSGFEKKDVCNSYKKETVYELYEICPCMFYAHEKKEEIILIKQIESLKYCEKNKDNNDFKFGEKIKKILDDFDVMIKDLAEKIGVDPKQISNYIHGRRSPSLTSVEIIAEALKVSPSWLAGFIDIDIRNTYVMQDNPEKTIYLHPFQYVITKIEDNGNKITLKKIQKE